MDLDLVDCVAVGVGCVLSMKTSSQRFGEGASGVVGESGALRVGDPGGVSCPDSARLRAADLRIRWVGEDAALSSDRSPPSSAVDEALGFALFLVGDSTNTSSSTSSVVEAAVRVRGRSGDLCDGAGGVSSGTAGLVKCGSR